MQNDIYLLSSSCTDYYKNGVFDKSGDLLFSVNANGIYAPNAGGTMVYDFYQTISTPFVCPMPPYHDVVNTNAKNAASEIPIFPVPGTCYSYYMMFWSTVEAPPTGPFASSYPPQVLRVIRVDIDRSRFGNTAFPVTSWYTITENLMNPPDCIDWYRHMVAPYDDGGFGVAANRVNADGSRDVYTVNKVQGSTGMTVYYYSNVVQWHFPSTGGLPTATTVFTSPTATSPRLAPIRGAKTKILQLPSATAGDTDPVLAFVAMEDGSMRGNLLQTLNFIVGRFP